MLKVTTIKSLKRAYTAWSDASQYYARIKARDQEWTPERVSSARHLEKTTKTLRERYVQCCMEFARSWGWKWHPWSSRTAGDASRAGFKWDFPEIDHPDVFYHEGRVVALVTHSYKSLPELQEYAAKHGLTITPLPWSWHNPGGCTAALLTRAAEMSGKEWWRPA